MEVPLSRTGSKSQDLNEQLEDNKSQDISELLEDNRSQGLNEQGSRNTTSHELDDQGEDDDKTLDGQSEAENDGRSQDLTEPEEASKSQDLKAQSEEETDFLLETSELLSQEADEYLSSSSKRDTKDYLSSFFTPEPSESPPLSSARTGHLKEIPGTESTPGSTQLWSKKEVAVVAKKEDHPFFPWKNREDWRGNELHLCTAAERKYSFHESCCFSATEQLIKHSPENLPKGQYHKWPLQNQQAVRFRSEFPPSAERLQKVDAKRKRDNRGINRTEPQRASLYGLPKGNSRRSKVLYSLYTTFHDEREEIDPRDVQKARGLSRACSIFSAVRKGNINVSKLLLTLHTLGILLTGAEMREVLKFVPMDAHGNLDFCNLLDVMSGMFADPDTKALQKAQYVFRKINKDMVYVDELGPILACLGVTLNPKIVQRALGCSRITWNGKVNISEFLSIVRAAVSHHKEIDRYDILERCFDQSSACHVDDLETQWKRKSSSSNKLSPHIHLVTFYEGDEQLQEATQSQEPSEKKSPTESPTEEADKIYQGPSWPTVQSNFGYSSHDTLFPLSTSLSFKDVRRLSFQQPPKTEALPSLKERKEDPVADVMKSIDALQKKQKKQLCFQEKLPRRYDSEERKPKDSNSIKSDNEVKQPVGS